MIVDAIIALFAQLFGALFGGVAMVVVPVINLLAAGIEAVVGVFVSGFSLGRIERKRDPQRGQLPRIGGLVAVLVAVGLLTWWFILPKMMHRQVTVVATDGHSLPFAAMIVHTRAGTQHLRADNAGNFVVPRFGTRAITIKDPRYVEKTWRKGEIEAELVVERTVLGSSLDSLADKLLKRAKE